MNQVMTREQIREIAPSVFAEGSAESTSGLYQQYPTSKIIDLLEGKNWLPVKAREQRVNNVERQGYQKHLIRFRSEKDIRGLENNKIGQEIFEIVLINSHDGKSCYNICAGLYRLVCLNGLVVGNDSFSMKVKHIGNTPNEVLNASMNLVDEMPKIMDKVESLKAIDLTEIERRIFATSAYLLKWKPETEDIPEGDLESAGIRFDPAYLLSPKRSSDEKKDLWTTFNTVQENIIKGRNVYDKNKGNRKLRAVKSIHEDIKLNKALWNLTEEMAKLKK